MDIRGRRRVRRYVQVVRARRRLRGLSRRVAAADVEGVDEGLRQVIDCFDATSGQPMGATAEELAVALNVLAEVHLAAAELWPAVRALDRALAVLPADPKVSATRSDTLVRRGTARRLLARYADAEQDLAQAVELAPDELRRAGALNARGILAKDTHRFEEAGACYGEALLVMERHHGRDAVATAALLHNLAGLEHARGRPADGEPYIRRAIAARQASLPLDRAALASDRGVLAALLAAQGRHDEARQMFRQLSAEWAELRGADHYEVGFCEDHLGVLAQGAGALTEAAEHFRRALTIKTRTLGDDHPEVAALRSALATCTGQGL